MPNRRRLRSEASVPSSGESCLRRRWGCHTGNVPAASMQHERAEHLHRRSDLRFVRVRRPRRSVIGSPSWTWRPARSLRWSTRSRLRRASSGDGCHAARRLIAAVVLWIERAPVTSLRARRVCASASPAARPRPFPRLAPLLHPVGLGRAGRVGEKLSGTDSTCRASPASEQGPLSCRLGARAAVRCV